MFSSLVRWWRGLVPRHLRMTAAERLEAELAERARNSRELEHLMRDWLRVVGEHESARNRAWELFFDALTPAQKRSVKTWGYFYANGSQGGRYRVGVDGYLANIYDVRNHRKICIYVRGKRDIPLGDHLLAQKLTIETNERQFLRRANFTPLPPF